MELITECLDLVDRGDFNLLTAEQCLDRNIYPPAMLVKTRAGTLAIVKKNPNSTLIFTEFSAVKEYVSGCMPMPMYSAHGYQQLKDMLLLDSDGFSGIIVKHGGEIVFQIQTH